MNSENNQPQDENEIEEILNEEEIYSAENENMDKIKTLRENLKKCNVEKLEYLTGWQRARADYINAKKNEEKTRQEIFNYQSEKIFKEFVEIMDIFDEVFKNSEYENVQENFRHGIAAIYNKLIKLFERHGVSSFNSVGQNFDPEKHEALAAEETNEKEKDNIVLEEFQKGYNINNKVLRPSKVKVGIYKEKDN